MKHFSKYDCDRSIPNAIDGWKISTRKILYSCFKRNLVSEIKVAQLAGYVSEHSGYHHGEMSLIKGIIGMAQEYVGSNNVNVLMPNGQFGTRLMGGKDHASERYIFTALNPLTKFIFRDEDREILSYNDDDGDIVEPVYYLPVIPYALINGGKGIGTGFSYEGMSYNLNEVVTYLVNKINGKPKDKNIELHPYYEGFKGTIVKNYEKTGKYLIKGKYKIVSSDTIKITELPIGSWTTDYNAFLENLMGDKTKAGKKKTPILKKKTDMCTDVVIDFTLKFYPGVLPSLISKQYNEHINMLEKTLNLTTTKSLSNMNLFTSKNRLKKYKDVYAIVHDYYNIRLLGYHNRKKHLINKMEKQLCLLTNRARFILEQCEDIIDLRKKKKDAVIALLKERNYDTIDGDEEFKYLRTMRIEQVEEENVEKLVKEKGDKLKALEILKNTPVKKMWKKELKELLDEFGKYQKARAIRQGLRKK